MADSIGQAYVQILPTTKGFGATLSSELSGQVGSTSSAVKKTGSKLGGFLKAGIGAVGITAGILAGIGKGFSKLSKDTADYGDQVDKMSQRVGLSAESYQKWDYVMKIAGTEMSNMRIGLKTMTNQIDQAKNGSTDAQDRFAKLGISMKDLSTMSREQAFGEVIKGFQNMKDGTERAALANKIFGRSGQELTPLFNQSAKSTDELIKKAEAYGMIMSNEAVKASAEFKDSLTTLQQTMTGLKNRLGAEFLPSLTQVSGGLASVFAGDTTSGLEQISTGLQGFVAQISTTLPQVLSIGGNILLSLADSLIANLPTLLPAILDVIISLGNGLINMAPQLLSAGFSLIVSLGQSLIKGLPKIMSSITKVISQLALMLTNPKNLTMLITTAVKLIVTLAEGLVKAQNQLVAVLPKVVMNLVNTFIKLAPKLVPVALKLITTLAKGLISSIALLLRAGGEIFRQLIAKFKSIDFGKSGRDIVAGIIRGIQNKASQLYTTMKKMAKQAWENFKSKFKIGSPSKVMEDIAKWIPIGASQGVLKNAHYFYSAMDELYAKSPISSQTMSMDISTRDVSSGYSYRSLFNAIKEGASQAQPIVILNDRILSRELKGMGVQFAQL